MKATPPDDRQEILNHIHSIFQAFIRQDRDYLRQSHSPEWTGFLGPSTCIERGLGAYLANAEKSLQNFNGVAYELLDSEIQLHGDLAIVYYVARYDYRGDDGQTHSIPLRSVDIYRRDHGHWIQSGSHITVIPSSGAWGEGNPK